MLPRSLIVPQSNSIPHLNPDICNGLAVKHMKELEEYIDPIYRSVAQDFPPGLKYLGCRRCDPVEEYKVVSRDRGGKRTFDVARSDIYLMEFKFRYNDEEPISKFIYLPFVGQASTIHLSGSRYTISPILADQVISVGLNGVFVRLQKAKLTFTRISHHYRANGATEYNDVVWSKIYNKKTADNQPKATTNAKSCLVHYLLCKHGFSNMFKLYTNTEPVVGTNDITIERYPSNEWVICESTQLTPKGYKFDYVPTEIRIAVRKKDYTNDVKNLITGFFYLADNFPSRVRTEYIDDPRLWMVLMGHVIWSGHVSEGKLYSDIQDHIDSLDSYMDNVYYHKLKALGYECRDIYQLFFRITSTFNQWLLQADDLVSTMYEKELSILPFVCYEPVSAINNLYFQLNAAKKKPFTSKKISNLMGKNLKQGMIFKLNKELGSVTTISASGDNMALKLTNALTPQNKSSKSASKTRANLSDPTKRLHASIAEVGSAWALPKSDADGRSRVNPTLQLSPTGLVLRDPKYIELIKSVQQRIKRGSS